MKMVLKILLALSTILAVAAASSSEMRYEKQYQQTLETLPKLNLATPLDTTLPATKTPFTDFVKANESFYDKYLLVIRWLSGTTLSNLKCSPAFPKADDGKPDESRREVERRSLEIGQDGLRNFDIGEYVTKVPGYADCKLSVAESAAVFDYTNSFYKTLNNALRTEPDFTNQTQGIQAFAATLDRALDKFAGFEGWVKRGTTFSTKTRTKYALGARVSDLAYTSTTLKKQFTGDDQLEIYSRTGKYIAPLSANHSEEEVLFKRNTLFEVIAVWQNPTEPHVRHYRLVEIPTEN